jgi:hypothetical protein
VTWRWTRRRCRLLQMVPDVLRAMLLLLDRLTALDMCVTLPPALTGRFTGQTFLQFVAPVEPQLAAVLGCLGRLGAAVKQALQWQHQPHSAQRQQEQQRQDVHLLQLLAELAELRRVMRTRLMQVRPAVLRCASCGARIALWRCLALLLPGDCMQMQAPVPGPISLLHVTDQLHALLTCAGAAAGAPCRAPP